jgi:hypothetical protein
LTCVVEAVLDKWLVNHVLHVPSQELLWALGCKGWVNTTITCQTNTIAEFAADWNIPAAAFLSLMTIVSNWGISARQHHAKLTTTNNMQSSPVVADCRTNLVKKFNTESEPEVAPFAKATVWPSTPHHTTSHRTAQQIMLQT